MGREKLFPSGILLVWWQLVDGFVSFSLFFESGSFPDPLCFYEKTYPYSVQNGGQAVLEYAVFVCIRRTFMAENKVMTLRLEPELRKRLDGLAKAQRRSRSFIAAEAIREYVAVNEWQIEEIRKGLAEADRGEFASDEQVRRTMSKWTGRKPTRRAG